MIINLILILMFTNTHYDAKVQSGRVNNQLPDFSDKTLNNNAHIYQ